MNILLLNGPNLNLLGIRSPEIYGATTLDELERQFATWATPFGVTTVAYQSNHEGALIDRLHEAPGSIDAIVFNPGALTHTSYAIHDAIEAVGIPTVEVHISNVEEREDWRTRSVIAPVCEHRIYGRGIDGYRWALRHAVASQITPAQRLSYGEDPQQFVQLRRGGPKLAILIHGGFWRHMWSFDTLDLNAIDLVDRGWSVASIEYRRVGNGGGWPVSRQDVLEAVQHSVDTVGATTIVLIGHSAGGQLALEVARHLGRHVDAVSMAGVNDMISAVDDQLGNGAAVDYLDGADPRLSSPLEHPPAGRVIIAHGTDDDRVPFFHAERYAERHQCQLLATPNGDHFRFLDTADSMWTSIAGAIEEF